MRMGCRVRAAPLLGLVLAVTVLGASASAGEVVVTVSGSGARAEVDSEAGGRVQSHTPAPAAPAPPSTPSPSLAPRQALDRLPPPSTPALPVGGVVARVLLDVSETLQQSSSTLRWFVSGFPEIGRTVDPADRTNPEPPATGPRQLDRVWGLWPGDVEDPEAGLFDGTLLGGAWEGLAPDRVCDVFDIVVQELRSVLGGAADAWRDVSVESLDGRPLLLESTSVHAGIPADAPTGLAVEELRFGQRFEVPDARLPPPAESGLSPAARAQAGGPLASPFGDGSASRVATAAGVAARSVERLPDLSPAPAPATPAFHARAREETPALSVLERPAVAATVLLLGLALLGAVLYHRIRAHQALEHPVRRRIFETIRARKGASPSVLAAELGLHWTAVGYHLRVLERSGMARSVRRGRAVVFVAAGEVAHVGQAAVSASSREVLCAVAADPGRRLAEYARALGVPLPLLHYHVRRLVEAGDLVHVAGPGRRKRYAPAPETAVPALRGNDRVV